MAVPDRYRNRGLSGGDPMSDLERALRRVSELMERRPGAWPEWGELAETAFSPLADLEETEDAYIVEVELPG